MGKFTMEQRIAIIYDMISSTIVWTDEESGHQRQRCQRLACQSC